MGDIAETTAFVHSGSLENITSAAAPCVYSGSLSDWNCWQARITTNRPLSYVEHLCSSFRSAGPVFQAHLGVWNLQRMFSDEPATCVVQHELRDSNNPWPQQNDAMQRPQLIRREVQKILLFIVSCLCLKAAKHVQMPATLLFQKQKSTVEGGLYTSGTFEWQMPAGDLHSPMLPPSKWVLDLQIQLQLFCQVPEYLPSGFEPL